MKIVFDIGGTNMRIALAEGEALREIRKVPTPQNAKDGVEMLARIAHELAGKELTAAVGDVPSSVDSGGHMYNATNLPQWEGTNIVGELSHALGTSVRVLNDTVVVGYGETQKGAGRGFQRVAYITVSTGVGGALIDVNDVSKSPLLAELGAVKPRLEAQVSGTAVRKKFGIHPKDLESLEEREKLADILAGGLAEIAAAWKPDVFVLGGSMIVGTNPVPLERAEESLRARGVEVPVKMAELEDNGGLIGACVLAVRPNFLDGTPS